jgi:hypothetical protein
MEEKNVHVVFKYLSKSLLLNGELGDGQNNASPLTTILFSSWFVDISIKDDITVSLHLGAAFMCPNVLYAVPEFRKKRISFLAEYKCY